MEPELTRKRIIELVDESKDWSQSEQVNLAYTLPSIACSLYVHEMKRRHGIRVAI